MYPGAATESTPAENTRARTRPDRVPSAQSLADASAFDVTVVRAPSPTLSEPALRDARAAEATLQLPPLVSLLPIPTPNASDRDFLDRDVSRVPSPAPIEIYRPCRPTPR